MLGNNPLGGNLFGNKPTAQPTGGTPSGGIFGGGGINLQNSQTKPQTNSLFGGPQSSTQTQPQGNTQPSNIFGGNSGNNPTQSNTGNALNIGNPSVDDKNKLSTNQPNPNFGQTANNMSNPLPSNQNPQTLTSLQDNLTVDELFKDWRKNLEDQVHEFDKYSQMLNDQESEIQNYNFKLLQYGKIIQTVSQDYMEVEGKLTNISNQQDELMLKLTSLEEQLLKVVNPEETRSSSNLLQRAQETNREFTSLEDELKAVSDKMGNYSQGHSLSKALNSYFDALEYIESDAVTLKSQMMQLAQKYN